MTSKPINIMDPSVDDGDGIIALLPEGKGTHLIVTDDGRELILREFPKLKTKRWKRSSTPPNGQVLNSVRIKHEQGLEIAKVLARHGLRMMFQDWTGPIVRIMPFDAHLRQGRPDLH